MKAEDLILVSVDDHLVEPPSVFEGRLPAKFTDAAPHVERREDGSDVWMFNGTVIPNVGLNAVAGRPRKSTASSPPRSTRCVPVVTTCMNASRT